MNDYNGWANYATWRINLEWFDGVDDVFCDAYKGEDLWDFADNIEGYVRDALEQQAYSADCTVLSYALAFIQDVDWYQIAKHLTDNYEE